MRVDDGDNPAAKPASPSSIVFRLDSRSGVPTYKQLVQQVERAVRLGYLARGDQLPRVKDAVAALSINPNTVLKAYRELEQKGIIAVRPGSGTFVQVSPGTVGLAELDVLRQSLVSGWLRDAAAAGLEEDGIVALFMRALDDFLERSGAPQPADRRGQPLAWGQGEGAA
jgi:GntR family transcriptional regulator